MTETEHLNIPSQQPKLLEDLRKEKLRIERLIKDCDELARKALMTEETKSLLRQHRAGLVELLSDYENSVERDFLLILEELERERLKAEKSFMALDELRRELEIANEALQFLDSQKTQLLAKLEDQKHALERQSREDGLTGLYNRRFLDITLAQEFERSSRFRHPFSAAIADIDHFKQINDKFSHQIGDEVIRTVAQILKNTCRTMDILGRYGGEEFVIGFVETPLPNATAACEKIRRSVEEFNWLMVHPDLRVTLSIGVAENVKAVNHEKMLSEADKKLYEAKRAGRNLVRY